MMIVRMPFDFDGEEVACITDLIAERMLYLSEQSQTPERDQELDILMRFMGRLGPVIDRGVEQVLKAQKAQMN